MKITQAQHRDILVVIEAAATDHDYLSPQQLPSLESYAVEIYDILGIDGVVHG